MSSSRETWQFSVREVDDGELSLSPQPRNGSHPPLRGRATDTFLDRWNIDFHLPRGTDVDDARRIAELLNDWVQEVSCTARDRDL